ACSSLNLNLGDDHPFFRWYSEEKARRTPGYAWYVRVADLPAFVTTIAPVLEARLAASEAVGYSGELRLSFYRDGVGLRFENGTLAEAVRWQPTGRRDVSAAFPDLTFLQLLFGYRSLAELLETYPDCWTDHHAVASLLDVLLPKRVSLIHYVS